MRTRNLSPSLVPTASRTKDTGEHWIRAGHYDPDFAAAVCDSLEELAALKPNWDGYGAPPIHRDIIDAARAFVRALPDSLAYRPRVVPMSTGNLQLEWHHGSKVLELEFESPKLIHYLQWHLEVGVEEEHIIPVSDIEAAVDLIQWFMSGTTCV